MITTEYELPIFEYYKNAAKRHTGGGLFGGIVTKILHPLFGTIGTFVILIAVLAVMLKAAFVFYGCGKTAAETSFSSTPTPPTAPSPTGSHTYPPRAVSWD